MMSELNPNLVVIDPVCGMEIDPAQALTTRQVGNQTFYFCSNFCAQIFDPEMTDEEQIRLRAAIGGEPAQRRTMPVWWVRYWTRKGVQMLGARYLVFRGLNK